MNSVGQASAKNFTRYIKNLFPDLVAFFSSSKDHLG
jgi:hypothetical protein